jgi:hypothetical protein
MGLAIIPVCAVFLLLFGASHPVNGQSGHCPYRSGIPSPGTCLRNPNPTPITSPLGGAPILPAVCRDILAHAVASLYSYDDAACHPVGDSLSGGSRRLLSMQKIDDLFPAIFRRLSQESSFQGVLYCESSSRTLILAFRGSAFPTLSTSVYQLNDDWVRTNLAQHLGDLPVQYQLAEAAAFEIAKERRLGAFDDTCGEGRPEIVLAGHSKGGGQAQYAAVRTKLRAVVFNSDLVNSVLFSDSMYAVERNVLTRWFRDNRRWAQSVMGCATPQANAQLSAYFSSGRIRDIRLTNDPLTEWLFTVCGTNLPQAPVEWVANNSTCSDDGHSIETLIRELQECAR